MNIYVVITRYMNSGFFGTYSTIKRARLALEQFLAEDDDVISVEDVGHYCYHFTTANGEEFDAEILRDLLDVEFVEGSITE